MIVRRSSCLAAVAVLALGCSSGSSNPGHGSVLVRVAALAGVSRVALDVQPANVQQELALADDGTFSGSLVLPVGAQVLTATAWDATRALGTGTANVTVVENRSVAALIRILDSTVYPGVDHGPVITSVVHPVAVLAREAAALSASATDLDADPISWQWSDSGCGAFGTSTAASTSWSRDTPGRCSVTVVATSKGLSDAVSFTVAVLLTPAGMGEVDVTGVFVPTPRVQRVELASAGAPVCAVDRAGSNATCPGAAPLGATVDARVLYDLGTTATGALTVALDDACGGSVVPAAPPSGGVAAFRWQAPATPSVCLLTARVVHEGLADAFPIAVPVRCADDPWEPNDSVSAAADLGTLSAGVPRTLSGLFANDDDWYLVTVPAGVLSATVTAADALRVEIFDASLVAVAEGIRAAQASVAAGTYRVHVGPGASAASCSSTYGLVLSSP